jgi:hypothetical protein
MYRNSKLLTPMPLVLIVFAGPVHAQQGGWNYTLPVAGLSDNLLKPLQILTTEGNTCEE